MAKIKKIAALLTVLVFMIGTVSILAGCGATKENNNYPVEVNGQQIDKSPTGVVVLDDSLADVILDMRYEYLMKGRSESCTEEQLAILPVYSLDNPSEIAGSGADYVLLGSEPTEDQRTALENVGLKVMVFAPATNRDSLVRLYTNVGGLLNGKVGQPHGEKSANNILLTLDDISRSIPARKTVPTACYVFNMDGKVATGDTFLGKLFGYCGLTNVFNSQSNNEIGNASIQTANPQYIFCNTGLKDDIINDKRFKNTAAVKNNHVYEISEDIMTAQGANIYKAAAYMAGYAYPELLKGENTSSEATKDSGKKNTSSKEKEENSSKSDKTSVSSVYIEDADDDDED